MDNWSRTGFQKSLKVNTTLKPSFGSHIHHIESPFSSFSKSQSQKEFKIQKSKFNKTSSKQAVNAALRSEVKAEYQQISPQESKNALKTDRSEQPSALSRIGFQQLGRRDSDLNEGRSTPSLLKLVSLDANYSSGNNLQGSALLSSQENQKDRSYESKELKNSAKQPSYLSPTFAALRLKSQKFEIAGEKPRFSFGKSQPKNSGYVDWSPRNAEAQLSLGIDRTPKGSKPQLNLVSTTKNEDSTPRVPNTRSFTHVSQHATKVPSKWKTKSMLSVENSSLMQTETTGSASNVNEDQEHKKLMYSIDEKLSLKEESIIEPAEIKSAETLVTPTKRSPLHKYPDFVQERYESAYRLIKLDPTERSQIEESFRLNPDFKEMSVLPSPFKVRESNSPQISQLLKQKLETRARSLAETELFADIREFWNSGPNQNLSAQEKKKLLFKIDCVDGFTINTDSAFGELMQTDNEIIRRNMEKHKSLSHSDRIKLKEKAMVAKFNLNNQVVQPNFMKDSGTMCLTEFWSDRQRHTFNKTMKEQVRSVHVGGVERDQWESVYRPGKIKSQKTVNNKLNQLKGTFGPGDAQYKKPEFKRYSLATNNRTDFGYLINREDALQKKLEGDPKVTDQKDGSSKKAKNKGSTKTNKKVSIVRKWSTKGALQLCSSNLDEKESDKPTSSFPLIKQEDFMTKKYRSLTSLDSKLDIAEPLLRKPELNCTTERAAPKNSLAMSARNDKISASYTDQRRTIQATEGDPANQTKDRADGTLKMMKKISQHILESPQAKQDAIGFTGGSLKDDYNAACLLYKTLSHKFGSFGQ